MAAARKGWEALSEPVRHRYERAGVDRAAYESGVSLKGPRGHAQGEGHAAKRYDNDKTNQHGYIIGGPGKRTILEYLNLIDRGKVRELNPSDLRAMARRMPREGRSRMAFFVLQYGSPPKAQWIGTRLERRELERAADRVTKEAWTMAVAVQAMVQQLDNNPPQGVYGIALKE